MEEFLTQNKRHGSVIDERNRRLQVTKRRNSAVRTLLDVGPRVRSSSSPSQLDNVALELSY